MNYSVIDNKRVINLAGADLVNEIIKQGDVIMLALQKKVYIPKDHKLQIHVPESIPAGDTEIFMLFQQEKIKKQKKRKLGVFKGKGSFKIKDDFKMTGEELVGL